MLKINKLCLFFCALLTFTLLFFTGSAYAESPDASTMHLLSHEGTVDIFDVSGTSRLVMDQDRFISGESIKTGSDGKAAIAMDDTKIVYLDADTSVELIQEGSHMQLNLSEGGILIDVQKKMDENSSFDIRTDAMTVSIHGTIVFLGERVDNNDNRRTTLGVLEGTAQVDYTDTQGTQRGLDVPAGQKTDIKQIEASNNAGVSPVLTEINSADIAGFVADTVRANEPLTERVINGSENGALLLQPNSDPASPITERAGGEELFPADGDWIWSGQVTIIAQSASKLYDGTPLVRPSGALVHGLPGDFNIRVTCSGSQTNVGSCVNVVSSYTITNVFGENVTSHFTNVETVDGTLVVDPAPLVVWTGSAEKKYDGEPLTCEEAGIRTVPGYNAEGPSWQNTSLITQTALGSEKMFAISGCTYVQGTNPLTGETKELELYAGQSLSVALKKEEDGDSLEFVIENLKEDQLPEEVLRLYADNPELLARACKETGWNPETIASLIADLPAKQESPMSDANGLQVAVSDKDNIMTDSANVRIQVDSQNTNYNTRALTSEEANFKPITLDPSITVTATGSQTEVGKSDNTYEIKWGNADPANYVISEDLGTLTVLPKNPDKQEEQEEPNGKKKKAKDPISVTLTAKSAEKVYDGEPLTAKKVTAEGLPEGYTFTAEVTSSQTEAGKSENKIKSYNIFDIDGNDITESCEVTLQSGTLTVEPLNVSIDCQGGTFTYDGDPFVPSPVLTYENGPHAGETVIGTRSAQSDSVPIRLASSIPVTGSATQTLVFRFSLFTGDTVDLTVSGAGRNAGTYTLSASISASSESISASFTGTAVTIEPAVLTITTGSAAKEWDGTPLTSDEISVDGLQGGDQITVTANGTRTEVGESKNTYTIDWGDTNSSNYIIEENLGILEVTEAKTPPATEMESETETDEFPSIRLSAPNEEKPYDGTPLTPGPVSAEGLPDGYTVEAAVSGSQTDAGTSECTITSYKIYNSAGEDVTDSFTDVSTESGSLTVTPASVVFNCAGTTAIYGNTDYTPSFTLSCNGASVSPDNVNNMGDGIYEVSFTLPAGDKAALQIKGLHLMRPAGTYPLEYSGSVSGNASNYSISYTNTSIIITTRHVILTSADDSKVYDGEPLTNFNITVGGDGFAPGEGALYEFIGSQTKAGSSLNEFEIYPDDFTDLNNYNIEISFGTLTVTTPETLGPTGE